MRTIFPACCLLLVAAGCAETGGSSSYSSSLVIEQVYSGLIQYDENMNIQPDLAESWTVSPDGLTYDFKLRQGVKFHNGRAMTADDVLYSLNRVKDPNGGSPRSYLLENVKSIDAPDRPLYDA